MSSPAEPRRATDLVALHEDDVAAIAAALRRVLAEPAFRLSTQQVASPMTRTCTIGQVLSGLTSER